MSCNKIDKNHNCDDDSASDDNGDNDDDDDDDGDGNGGGSSGRGETSCLRLTVMLIHKLISLLYHVINHF